MSERLKPNIRLCEFNAEGALSYPDGQGEGRGTASGVLSQIAQLEPNITFMPESSEHDRGLAPGTEDMLVQMAGCHGEVISFDYVGSDGRGTARRAPHDVRYNDSATFVTNLPVHDWELIELGRDDEGRYFRRGLRVIIGGLAIYCVHFDNERPSTRMAQARDLASDITETGLSTVVVGDFNGTDGRGGDAWFLRNVVGLLAQLPFKNPDGLVASALYHDAQMGVGHAHEILTRDGGLVRVGHGVRTMTPKTRNLKYLPSIPVASIDGVYTTPDIEVVSDLKAHPDIGSDHRPITVDLALSPDSKLNR
jgi:endonuclease/exonuclease/phosphatase family metal-dependent hydrolase